MISQSTTTTTSAATNSGPALSTFYSGGQYYVTYITPPVAPIYEIDQDKESSDCTASTDITMASVAVESSNSIEYGSAAVGGTNNGEPIFTSSDLPLQPYHLTGSTTSNAGAGPSHNDLFVNPAFAHMSFLSDGSMVGPNGEIYSPAEYFPSLLVEHSQEVPAVIPVSPQPGEYPSMPAPAATPPPLPPGGNLIICHLRQREREFIHVLYVSNNQLVITRHALLCFAS